MFEKSAHVGRVILGSTPIPVLLPSTRNNMLGDYDRRAELIGSPRGGPYADDRACLALFLHYAGLADAHYPMGQRLARTILNVWADDCSDADENALQEGRAAIESIQEQIDR